MAWSTIREATAEDIANLEAAAERFCDRHNLAGSTCGDTWQAAVDAALEAENQDVKGISTAAYCGKGEDGDDIDHEKYGRQS